MALQFSYPIISYRPYAMLCAIPCQCVFHGVQIGVVSRESVDERAMQ